MAGLLAANLLRHHNVHIIEAKLSLPHNHSAVLRFRSPAIGAATGIAFEEIRVDKGFFDGVRVRDSITLDQANQYSLVVTRGESVDNRSVWNLGRSKRWIAPPDFIERMAHGLNISYGVDIYELLLAPKDIVISTLPMPVLIKMTGREEWIKALSAFCYGKVYTIKALIDHPVISTYQTLYQAETGSWYRASLHAGGELILEFANAIDVAEGFIFNAMHAFGIPTFKVQSVKADVIPFGKILPINEAFRRQFIFDATQIFGIYSLGRFATWRPGLLMDDLVKDVQQIERMILGGSYANKIQQISA